MANLFAEFYSHMENKAAVEDPDLPPPSVFVRLLFKNGIRR